MLLPLGSPYDFWTCFLAKLYIFRWRLDILNHFPYYSGTVPVLLSLGPLCFLNPFRSKNVQFSQGFAACLTIFLRIGGLHSRGAFPSVSLGIWHLFPSKTVRFSYGFSTFLTIFLRIRGLFRCCFPWGLPRFFF